MIPRLGHVINNTDRFCPQFLGVWDALQMAFSWLIDGGYSTNYFLTGMIFQVGDWNPELFLFANLTKPWVEHEGRLGKNLINSAVNSK